MDSRKLSDLPKHEVLRASGQLMIQAGLLCLSVASVLRQIGELPDTPIFPSILNQSGRNDDYRSTQSRGYFD